MSNDSRPPSLARLFLLLAPLSVFLTGCGANLIDRLQRPRWGICGTLIIILDIVALVDLLGDEGRSTGSKVIWALVIILAPVLGVILYFLFG